MDELIAENRLLKAQIAKVNTDKVAGAQAAAEIGPSAGYVTVGCGVSSTAASSTASSASRLVLPHDFGKSVSLPCDLETQTSEAVLEDWLDHIITAFWPLAGPALRNLLENEVFPSLPPNVAKYCKIKKFDLGSAGPSVKPLSVRKRTSDAVASTIIVDMQLVYDAAVDVVLDAGVCLLGVSSLKLQGTLTIVASELAGEHPCVGCLQFFFEQQPEFDLIFAKSASVAETIPKIKKSLVDGIEDMLRQYMVLPRALPAKWRPTVDVATRSYVEPLGILRFQMFAGRNLCRWKPRLGELVRLPSDVKVVVQCGGIKWISEVKSGTGDVSWSNAETAFLISGMQQLIQIDVFDEHYLGGPLVKHMAKLKVSGERVLAFENGWLELADEKTRVGAEHGTWKLEGQAAEPRALHVAVQLIPLGEHVKQGPVGTLQVLTKDAVGALQVRIGRVENLKCSGPVRARASLGQFSSITVQSHVEDENNHRVEDVVWLPVLNPPTFVLIEILDQATNVLAECKVKVPRALLGTRQAVMRMDPKGYVTASFGLRLYDDSVDTTKAQRASTLTCEAEEPDSDSSRKHSGSKPGDEKVSTEAKCGDAEEIANDAKPKDEGKRDEKAEGKPEVENAIAEAKGEDEDKLAEHAECKPEVENAAAEAKCEDEDKLDEHPERKPEDENAVAEAKCEEELVQKDVKDNSLGEEKPDQRNRVPMTENLQLVCKKLAGQGWSLADIADLVECAEEDVESNLEYLKVFERNLEKLKEERRADCEVTPDNKVNSTKQTK